MNDSLTFVKPHTITAASFQKPLASEVILTSHMLKLVKLSQQPKHSLIFSSEKVNADDDADKSLSGTTVQLVTQPKAPTDMKIKKKQIPPSSKPKSSYKVRVILLKKQFAKTQHAEETVTIANATQSLEASDSAEEQVNQPKTSEAEKVQDQNIQEEVKESGFESIEDPDDDAQFTFLGDEPSNFEYDHTKSTKLGDYDSDSGLRSIPDDDFASLNGFETPDSPDDESKEGTTKTFNAFADMPALSDTIGHLNEELRIVNTKIDQLESSVTKKVTDDIQSFMPSIVEDSLKENLPESIEEKLRVCAAQVQQSLQDQLLNILLKPINKEFNAFNTLESHWFVTLQQELSKDLRSMFKDMFSLLKQQKSLKVNAEGKKWEKNNPETPTEENPDQTQREQRSRDVTMVVAQGEQTTAQEQAPLSYDEPPVKKLKFLYPTPSSIPSPTPLKSIMLEPFQKPDTTTMTIDQFTEHLNKTKSSIFSPTPPREPTPPRDPTPLGSCRLWKKELKEMKRLSNLKAEKEKSEKSLQKIMNPATIRAQAQKMAEYEAKRKKMLYEYNHQTSHRVDQLPITKISYRVNSSKEATMRITRGNDLLNLTVYDKFRLKTLRVSEWLEVHALASKSKGKSNDLLLQSLRAKFEWVLTQAKKLGVEGRKGLVIRDPESGSFFNNNNFDLVFRREEEFYLATTPQLIRLQNEILRGIPEAEEFFKKLELTIEARNDANQARKIV
ncbi:hypothetical protein Tco_0565011 [Tanacetum coccineum]